MGEQEESKARRSAQKKDGGRCTTMRLEGDRIEGDPGDNGAGVTFLGSGMPLNVLFHLNPIFLAKKVTPICMKTTLAHLITQFKQDQGHSSSGGPTWPRILDSLQSDGAATNYRTACTFLMMVARMHRDFNSFKEGKWRWDRSTRERETKEDGMRTDCASGCRGRDQTTGRDRAGTENGVDGINSALVYSVWETEGMYTHRRLGRKTVTGSARTDAAAPMYGDWNGGMHAELAQEKDRRQPATHFKHTGFVPLPHLLSSTTRTESPRPRKRERIQRMRTWSHDLRSWPSNTRWRERSAMRADDASYTPRVGDTHSTAPCGSFENTTPILGGWKRTCQSLGASGRRANAATRADGGRREQKYGIGGYVDRGSTALASRPHHPVSQLAVLSQGWGLKKDGN
ncbi:hypothetical protein B0H16DRAFT_1457478 [Mycena metata]|uniref:Uncharacterized protein n=1 Tax=Mycena metata TaxID=1033252 RepID=A0AAD7J615_9AGAR|nr:hypothetical protein B0H16DRAFT_1457478 [Mycena metata]